MATDCLGNTVLKKISDDKSQSEARVTINDNFAKLSSVIKCMSQVIADQINSILPANTPVNGVQYVLQYNGSKYVMVEANTNPGSKFNIRADESVRVVTTNQYLIFDHLYLDGTLTIESGAECVIL